MFQPELLASIRDRFAHIDTCPFQGERIFFENAGGALTLKSVVETSATMAAMPDNLGRDNPAAAALNTIIEQGRADMRAFFGVRKGEVIVGESGTELLFRLVRAAALASERGGQFLGSTLEHPSSRSAAGYWAAHSGAAHVLAPHDNISGAATKEDYLQALTPQTRVVTIVHASPVTGVEVDLEAIVAAVRERAPACFIIVDGIQHAAHGATDLSALEVDAYVISPYKVFSRHGYGVAWLSERLALVPHERLNGSAPTLWELGTRDVGAFATFSDVVEYFEWLGQSCQQGVAEPMDQMTSLRVAGAAIAAQERSLTEALLYGGGGLAGLADLPGLSVLGGVDNPQRQGLLSFSVRGHESVAIVQALNTRGIRTHVRKNDHYSGNVLGPLGLDDCVRISMCHYNSADEVSRTLSALAEILA